MISTSDCKLFTMIRNNDETGISGTGRVLDGIVWSNGWVTICWRTEQDTLKKGFSSITMFESFAAFEAIHITSHPTNNTEIVWYSDEVEEAKAKIESLTQANKKLKSENRTYKNIGNKVESSKTTK